MSDKIAQRKITNIIINKMVNDLSNFENGSMDLVLLYDALHATSNKYMLYEESHCILKAGYPFNSSLSPEQLTRQAGKEKDLYFKIDSIRILRIRFFLSRHLHPKRRPLGKMPHPLLHQTFDLLEKVDVMNFVKNYCTDMNQNQENTKLQPAINQDVMMLTAFSKWAFETDVRSVLQLLLVHRAINQINIIPK